jgi:protein SCO1/2
LEKGHATSGQIVERSVPDQGLPMSRTIKAILGVWVLVLISAAGWAAWDSRHSSQPSIGGAFALTDQNGRSFTDADLKGKPSLIYFGYTFCPDACPTSLLLMETAAEKLGPGGPKKINLVFITIDPGRDKPEQMKGYVTSFGPTIEGLTGTPEQIAAVAKAYRVYFQKVPGKDGAPYLMDHSSIIYLLDRHGRFVTHFTDQTTAETIAEAVKHQL